MVRCWLEYEVTSVDGEGGVDGWRPLRFAIIDPRSAEDRLARQAVLPAVNIQFVVSDSADAVTWVDVPANRRNLVGVIGHPLSVRR